jgi:GNAT superfamily N-acetyltransferase
MNVIVRKAQISEHDILTDISFSAKRYWQYPESYYDVWRDELTIKPDYIENNIVYVALYDDAIVGYYSIILVPKALWAGKVFIMQGYWLEHIFIRPMFMRKGIGLILIEHAKRYCRRNSIDFLFIFSDPYAKGFYEKIGAQYIDEYPSSIVGRNVALFKLLTDR